MAATGDERYVGLGELAVFSARSALAKERTAERLLRVHQKLGRAADAETERIDAEGPAVDCRAGCDHCCHRQVFVAAAEVAAIAHYVRQTLSATETEALTVRAREYEAAMSPYRGGREWLARVACPLLVDGLCSVHPVRPLRCRATNSTDVGACVEWREHPQSWATVPSREAQRLACTALMNGLRMGLAQASVPSDAVELGSALREALERPDAAERLLEGEDVFAGVARPPEPPARPDLGAFRRAGEPAGEPEAVAEDVRAYDDAREAGFGLGAAKELLQGAGTLRELVRFALPRTYLSEAEIDEALAEAQAHVRRLRESRLDPAEAFDALALAHTFEAAYTGRDVTQLLCDWGDLISEQVVAPLFPDLLAPIERRSQGPLRVGFISANLRNNNGGIYALGWLEAMSPDIETVALNIGPIEDGISQRFQRAAGRYFHLPGPVPETARFIRAQGLDALIYTDIGMAARNTQFAAMRLAPVQAMGWGHPVTSGLPTMDYFLTSDPMEPSGGEAHYRERLVRLPRISWCYPRPHLPVMKRTKADLGLPDGFVALMCQNLMKCLPRWDGLLQGVAERAGRVCVLEGQNRGDTARTKARLERAGIPVVWIPKVGHYDYLRLQAMADVSLDTPAWSGGYTTLQSLALGTPVVTLPGEFMRGRHTFAMLQVAGADALIARTPEEYVEIATDAERLRHAMQGSHVDRLFGDRDAVQALESFLWKACRS